MERGYINLEQITAIRVHGWDFGSVLRGFKILLFFKGAYFQFQGLQPSQNQIRSCATAPESPTLNVSWPDFFFQAYLDSNTNVARYLKRSFSLMLFSIVAETLHAVLPHMCSIVICIVPRLFKCPLRNVVVAYESWHRVFIQCTISSVSCVSRAADARFSERILVYWLAGMPSMQMPTHPIHATKSCTKTW